MMLLSVNQRNFQQEVLESQFLVIVNFWVSRSQECKKMRSLMLELDKELMQACKIIEVNFEEEKELAERYQVYSAPSLLIFDEGELIGRHAGILNTQKFLREGGLLNLVVGRSGF